MGNILNLDDIRAALLTDQDLAKLKANGPRALPASPTAAGWSAEAIKKQLYKQPEMLFVWLKALGDAIYAMGVDVDDFLSAIEDNYVHLTGNETIAGTKTFSNGVNFDGAVTFNGTIVNGQTGYNVTLPEGGTLATQTYVYGQLVVECEKFKDGTYVAYKAYCDSNGNSIPTTYETKADAQAKVALSNLRTILGLASTTEQGLMSATDKARLDALHALLGESADSDTVVNTINEVLAIFAQYPEGVTLANALAAKVAFSDVINNTESNEINKPLSAYQGKVLKGLINDLTTAVGGLTPKSRTIAGVDLADNITKTELNSALDVTEAIDYTTTYESFDLNDLKYNSIKRMQTVNGGGTLHLPAGFAPDGRVYFVWTNVIVYSGKKQVQQMLLDVTKKVYYRRYWNETAPTVWGDWVKYDLAGANALNVDPVFYVSENLDLNDVKDNRVICMQPLAGTSNFSNLPSGYTKNATTAFLFSYSSTSHYVGVYQSRVCQFFLDPATGNCYRRVYNGATSSWSDWTKIPNGGGGTSQTVIEIGAGKAYTTLRAGFEQAIQTPNSKVIVYPGTYDLTSEFATELANHSGSGITLGNGVHAQFMNGAYVKCILNTVDSWAYDYFEPFHANGNNSDFTLEGLDIEAKNTRYCVHDESSGSGTYVHKYINCRMKYTNTNTTVKYVQCIGGGFGEYGTVEIVGGSYKSETTVPYSTYGEGITADDCQQPISFHNGYVPTCNNKLIVDGVYLEDKGYLRLGNYGASTIKSQVMIRNCSLGRPTLNMYETADSANANFEFAAFNNVARDSSQTFPNLTRKISLITNSD